MRSSTLATGTDLCPQYGNLQTVHGFRLIRRPKARLGESWPGYLLRLAAVNYLPGLVGLAQVCGDFSAIAMLRRHPQDVLSRLGVPVPDLSAWERGHTHGDHARKYRRLEKLGFSFHTRLCPCCLHEDGDLPYLRSEWDWPLQIHCSVHRVMLLEQCQQCARPIDMHRRKVARCVCGAYFTLQKTPGSGDMTFVLTKLLPEVDLDRLGQTFERAPSIHLEAARVCKWLGSPIGANGKRPAGKTHGDGKLCVHDIEMLRPLVSNWPNCLVQSIAPEVDLSSRNSRDVLRRRLLNTKLRLTDIVMEHLRPIADSVASPHKSAREGKSKNPGCNHIGLAAVNRVTGHAPHVLRRQIERGKIPDVAFNQHRRSNEGRYEVSAETLDKLRAFYAATNAIGTSAKMVGCSRSAMAGLVQSGCIAAGSICTDRSEAHFLRVSPLDLASMANKLFSIAKIEAGLNGERVFFSAWVNKHAHGKGHRHLRWRVVLTAIRTGKLTLFKTEANPLALDQLFLHRADLREVSDQRRKHHQCFL